MPAKDLIFDAEARRQLKSGIDALANASDAIDSAYAKVKLTSPNGRDYCTQGADAMAQAQREHNDRLSRLDMVKLELDAIILAIDDISAPAPTGGGEGK